MISDRDDPAVDRERYRSAALLSSLPVFLAALLALRRLDDSDTWWHLAAGRWIIEHGTVPRSDPFSFTVPDHAWTNVQWLFDAALYVVFRIGGSELVVVSTAIVFGSAFILLGVNLRRQLGKVASAILLLWVVLIAQERFTVRPEMISFVLLQVLLWLLGTAARDDGRRLWLLPVVMVLWANTHALFVIGALLIVCHLAAAGARRIWLPQRWSEAWKLTSEGDRRLCLWGVLSLLVTVLNPYGLEGAMFPLKLATRINGSNPVFSAINEFRSPFSGYAPSFSLDAYRALFTLSCGAVLLAVVITLIPSPEVATDQDVTAVNSRRRGVHVGRLLFFLALAFLSVLARRNTALFAVGAAPFVGESLLIVFQGMPAGLRSLLERLAPLLTLATVAVVLVLCALVATNRFYRMNLDTHELGVGVQAETFPMRAVDFIRDLKLPPRVYNDLTTGGYLTWDNPVGGGVYMDGRLEVYDAAFFSNYMTGVSDPERWQAEADHFGINTVILDHRFDPRAVLVRYLLQNARWALIYYDEMAVVFVRRAGSDEQIARAAASFPAARQQRLAQLLAPVSGLQWPVGRVLGLWNYGNMSSLIGDDATATTCFLQLLRLDLPAAWELPMRLRLAESFLQRAQPEAAREHVDRAAVLSPGNPAVVRLRAQLNG
ncbi:MAG: hypothetical protein HY270_09590 [Deltaproteobacteria bacterium]|nr:hypothetical protein [Deltaproteobacteria bacterium]